MDGSVKHVDGFNSSVNPTSICRLVARIGVQGKMVLGGDNRFLICCSFASGCGIGIELPANTRYKNLFDDAYKLLEQDPRRRTCCLPPHDDGSSHDNS